MSLAAVSIAQRVYVQLSSRKAAMGGGVQHGAAAALSEQRAAAGELAPYRDGWMDGLPNKKADVQ